VGARRATIIFIFITILLDMIALGVIIPVLPKLIQDFVGGDTARAATMVGWFATVWAAMQFIFSPIFGVLSDKIGRRPVILLSCLGLGVDYIFMALAPTLSLLFVGRLISGITSSNITAAGAYIADVTPPEKRAQGFGILGMAFGIGFILGPALGGVLGDISPRLPFWVAAGLSLVNTLYGIFVLPESLAKENRVKFEWRKANPVGSLKLLRSHDRLFGLAMVSFLINLAHAVLPTIFVLYAGYRYMWTPKDVGLTLAVVGIFSGVVQGGLVGPTVKFFGELNTLILGLLFGIMGFVIFGYAWTGKMFWVGIPLSAAWGLAGAVIQGMMTSHVAPNEQGQLQGASGSLRGITEMIGPPIFTSVFAYFLIPERNIPGAPFYLAALMLAVAVGFSFWAGGKTSPAAV